MDTADKIRDHITGEIRKMEASRDPDKKTIVVVCYCRQYRGHMAGLIEAAKRHYNVMVVVTEQDDDAFVRKYHPHFIPCSLQCGNDILSVDIDLPWIDLIVSPDNNLNAGQSFLSRSAPRIYFPHDILGYGANDLIANQYDYIFLPSVVSLNVTRQDFELRKARATHRLPVLIPGGYIKLDETRERYLEVTASTDKDSILYAPTLRSSLHSCDMLNTAIAFDEQVIQALLDCFSQNVIFRPHPFNSLNRFANTECLCQKFQGHHRVIIDKSNTPVDSYARSRVMLTDFSATAFTYAFTTLKQSVFFCPFPYQDNYYYNNISRVGVLTPTLPQCLDAVAKLVLQNGESAAINAYCRDTIFHFGEAKEYLLSCLKKILAGRNDPEWIRV